MPRHRSGEAGGLPPSPTDGRTRYSLHQFPGTSRELAGGRPSRPASVARRSPAPSLGDGDERNLWKRDLYLLQEKAPRPVAVVRASPPDGLNPVYYGTEFHGAIEREEAAALLRGTGEGAYLVRESQRAPGSYTLCMCFDGQILNYRLYYDGAHYVGEKRFERMEELVWDGLISMFVSKHAGDYIAKMSEEAVYEESPYSQYQKAATMGRSEGRGLRAEADGASMGHGGHSPSSAHEEDSGVLREAKAHRFKAHTFRVASYCDLCRNFMWGLVQQGLRCEDCGFAAHKRCSERTREDCQPHLRYVKRVFAVDLTTLCMAHKCTVPPVVAQCVEEIERRGLLVEGLYRVSGSHDEVAKLRNLFDTQAHRAGWLQAKLSRTDDIHTIASLHKLYLRLLPLPLIPLPVSRGLIAALRSPSTRLSAARSLLAQQLSPPHYDTLRVLLSHLWTVASYSGSNKMSAENLARIFAPTLLCAASPQAQGQAQQMPQAPAQHDHQLLHFLVTNAAALFS